MNRPKKRFISVIIPAYKQERTIRNDIAHIKSVLDQLRYSYEMLVVVDGMEDKTFARAKKVAGPQITVVGYKQNKGKGHALRYGIARAKGDTIVFIDSGMDLHPNGISMLLEHFEWYKADIVVGSKWHPVSKVDYPLLRKIISKGYGVMVKILFGLRVKDTQLGLKVFKREVLEKVLPRLLVKRFAIDIELLAVANRLGYTRIYEAPIELAWRDVASSSISSNLVGAIWDVFLDTVAVFYRLKILRYYDDGSRRIWKYDPELNFKVNIR
ncbi:MAG: glycosyltransferase [bacterium]|nr:glycosyltransferase [bacterium]